jgi:hypothetical protein
VKCSECGSDEIICRTEEEDRGHPGCLLSIFGLPLYPLELLATSLQNDKEKERWYCTKCGNELVPKGNGVYRLRKKVKTKSKAKDNNDSSST